MSTLMGHFVSSPTEREKTDRRDSKGKETEKLRCIKGKVKDNAETEEMLISSPSSHLLQVQQALTITLQPVIWSGTSSVDSINPCPAEPGYTLPLQTV